MRWFSFEIYEHCVYLILGGYSVGVPPLPIPNREVKPNCADGTAYCGRVGSCRSSEKLATTVAGFFFLCLYNHNFRVILTLKNNFMISIETKFEPDSLNS